MDDRPEFISESAIARISRLLHPFPEFPNPEIPGDGDEAVQVIRMRMGQDQAVDSLDAFVPEKGGNDVLPDVERPGRQAAAVDRAFSMSREIDQDGLALADVDHRDGQVLDGGGEGNGWSGTARAAAKPAAATRPGPGEPPGKEEKKEEGVITAPPQAGGRRTRPEEEPAVRPGAGWRPENAKQKGKGGRTRAGEKRKDESRGEKDIPAAMTAVTRGTPISKDNPEKSPGGTSPR